ncbi:hypothetical protein ISF_04638 [Cordyceps fumosorosea ARSEF 2679]|uniref:Uncharacterized protein n=1 Tax=Cordyceps fumosorosea (strain ARSEF 2679) TaxID=1081104 RepID=A0A167WL92_CORFA|nr:hypothetical protein ISF_04638 [Cordyceps fumosorosea ARSEF 2679]OAA63929.1 hypothetical protein ISF_04638 [Cordyceps fumosorosea ARSEF 2679]
MDSGSSSNNNNNGAAGRSGRLGGRGSDRVYQQASGTGHTIGSAGGGNGEGGSGDEGSGALAGVMAVEDVATAMALAMSLFAL